MKQLIYETKGRAREYNELAINIFSGCGHQCSYCYGADVTNQDKREFDNNPKARVTAEEVYLSAKEWKSRGETRRILLCFVTDPYQPIEQDSQLTRKCILAIHKAGLNVVILTKGGLRSIRDFDILTPKDAYATTLTLTNENDSKMWERFAGTPQERIDALKLAHSKGIETWVSFEPVLYPEETKKLFMLTKYFVGHYKVGTLNYSEHAKDINWRNYGWEMKRMMDKESAKYYFKKDLLKEMGVLSENFKQTWICR